MTEPAHIAAHKHSIRNKDEVLRSETCGCFYCLAIFPPADVKQWIRERVAAPAGSSTACCPGCGIDSVIGSASGYPVSIEFLRAMRRHWFEA